MAAKIKEGLRDITQGVVERLKGGPKYADNLLGESLQDQLRKATAKDLLGPNEELNLQVVDTINQDVANGKDSKEIVGLLKKRLRTDNPHKQWLAVLLVGRVMRDCTSSIGIHQEELLQEVARTMARPARPDSSSGRTTRQAAKELLRSYGRAGAGAFRAVNRKPSPGGTAAEQAEAEASSETASVVAEVQLLIEQAHANTELLSEMLLVGDGQQQQQQGAGAAASGSAAAGDEFENELTLELVTEVRELRTLFDAYLEQLQALSGPDVEAVMMKALEAVDLLDGALALQQDVASNQRELEQQASVNVAAAGGAGAGTSAASRPSERERNLIDLDDLADALLPQPPPVLEGAAAPGPGSAVPSVASPAAAPQPAQPQDPFATLDVAAVQHAVGSPPATSPAGLAAAPQQPFTAAAQQPYQHPFAYAPQPPQQTVPYGAQPFGSAGVASPPLAMNPNNPFAGASMPAMSYGSAVPPLTGAMSSNNPFAAPAAPAAGPSAGGAAAPGPLPSSGSAGQGQADAEWAMFFAGRTGAGAAAPQPQPQ